MTISTYRKRSIHLLDSFLYQVSVLLTMNSLRKQAIRYQKRNYMQDRSYYLVTQ